MKKRFDKFKVAAIVLCIALVATVVMAEPGSTSDPLISQAYIDDVLMPKIENYVDSRIAALGGGGNSSQAAADSFKVVEASAGKEIVCSAGCELILRMGSATIVATQKGGLADTTAGFDLADGTQMPANHLLIVPLSDGRGIKANTDIIVMIKGGYTIK